MRTSEKGPRLLWLGLALAAALSLARCNKEYVLPAELAALGSLESAVYVTRHVYPARDVGLQILRPRLGDPALLHADGQSFELVFYARDPADASDLRFTLVDDLEPGVEHALSLDAPPSCDAGGLCRAAARAPLALPEERLLTLCIFAAARSDCRSGAVYRYDAVPEPLRFAVIADPQLGGIEGEPTLGRRLERVFEAIAARTPRLHLALVVGDLTQGGTASQQELFLSLARAFPLPLLLIPGNHDFNDGNIVEYLARVLPHLDHVNRLGPYVFVGLNSGPQLRDQGGSFTAGASYGLEAAQVDWLAEQLAPEDQVELVYVHHPPYALFLSVIGSHRERFLEACRAGGVGVILAGHTHLNEVYDRAGIAQGLDPRCDQLPGPERRPISLVTARSTDRSAGYRELVVQPSGELSYCWKEVDVD
ncbi:MAG: metallophosphoesterase [bacterium]